jgi:hypothetical protein
MPTTRARASAAGVARVERGVGLDDVLDHAAPGRQGPAERADHAGRHRSGQPERVPHRDHQLADLELVGLAELSGFRGGAVRAQHREVGQRVGADHPERRRRAVGELRGAAGRLADHMGVGQQEPVAGEDHAGAEALAAAVASALSPAGDAEARDLGREPFGHTGDDLRICIQRVAVVLHRISQPFTQ